MAEKAIKKLEEHLSCSICLDTFKNPRQLQCNHVYCQNCLQKMVLTMKNQHSLACPNCRRITAIPASGVAGLQSAFLINYLLEIQDSVKKVCEPPTGTKLCPQHTETLELFCETCSELICLECAIKGGKHCNHDYSDIDKAYKKHHEDIAVSLKPMEDHLRTIALSLRQIDRRSMAIAEQQRANETDINRSIEQLHKILNGRKTILIHQLHQYTQSKLKILADQRKHLESTQAQLKRCVESIKEGLDSDGPGDLLMKKKLVKNMASSFEPTASLQPEVEADIVFSASSYISDMVQHYGDLLVPSLPDPSKCYITGQSSEVSVGEDAVAVIEVLNGKGQPCKQLVKSLKCEVVSEITGVKADCKIVRTGENQYQIVYHPTVKGGHRFSIEVEGQHIRGSPFEVTAKSAVKPEIPIQTLQYINSPQWVALNHKGELVVTDWTGHCVLVYTPTGEQLCSFRIPMPRAKKQFLRLDGVAVTTEGNIIVADYVNIHMLSPEGKVLSILGTDEKTFPIKHPVGIAFNAENNRIYISDDCHRIHILSSGLTFVKSFGKEGSGKGELSFPRGVACNSRGEVLVADSSNHRIQVFTADGIFLRMFGKRRGQFRNPCGIAIDSNDIVYVSDLSSHSVSVLSSDGQQIASFGQHGKFPGGFDHPVGIAVNRHGVVYVCDCNNNRVQCF